MLRCFVFFWFLGVVKHVIVLKRSSLLLSLFMHDCGHIVLCLFFNQSFDCFISAETIRLGLLRVHRLHRRGVVVCRDQVHASRLQELRLCRHGHVL